MKELGSKKSESYKNNTTIMRLNTPSLPSPLLHPHRKRVRKRDYKADFSSECSLATIFLLLKNSLTHPATYASAQIATRMA